MQNYIYRQGANINLMFIVLLGLLAAISITQVKGFCCAANNPFANLQISTSGIRTGSAFSPVQCGDCTYAGPFSCCATGGCNIFCCRCKGPCREGACSQRKRNRKILLGTNGTSSPQEIVPVSVHRVLRRADKDKDGRLSYEEVHDYLGTSRFNRSDVEDMDLDHDGFLSAEELDHTD